MSIKVLDPKVVARIAAGEVVERPASVVKELVENALDAASTQISVEAAGGGLGLIRVMDNGTGIPAADVEVAFQRHATSKISGLDDLEKIASLGFRGEALPSIAAVAQVEVVTRAVGEEMGTFVSLDDGAVMKKTGYARAQGTTVTVSHLLRKVPARLKFLKSPATENSRMADVVTRYALGYPGVRFTLLIDGKTTLKTPGSGQLLDCAIEVYGLNLAQNMLDVDSREGRWSAGTVSTIAVTGLVGSPQVSRSGRDNLSFFVNRRWISSRMLTRAVEEAYHGLLMEGRHPVAILNITLPAEQVDVNIHPAKSEVKFQDEGAVFAAVQKAVRRSLVRLTPVPRIEEVAAKFAASPAKESESRTAPFSEGRPRPAPLKPAPTPLMSLPLLRVVGQVSGCYIVAEGPDGLYLIDQHAAHERILFEKIKRQRSSQKLEVQGLLEPATLEVEPRQNVVLRVHYQDLADFGFAIEPFGERAYLVRSVPAILHDKDWVGMLRQSLDSLSGVEWAENLTVTMACHGAVRAGQILTDSEMHELVQQLGQTVLPNTCPHGRPTMIHLSTGRLEKEFGRS